MPSADEVRARHPLTVRLLGEAFLREYAEKAADKPFPEYVNARYALGTIPDRAVRDLVRFEFEMARLAEFPPLAGTDAPLPARDVPLVLSPNVALIVYGADLPGVLTALREGRQATPRPRRAWILLTPKGGGKVDVQELDRDGGWMMEWFRSPEPLDGVADMMEDDFGPVEELWRAGLLVRA